MILLARVNPLCRLCVVRYMSILMSCTNRKMGRSFILTSLPSIFNEKACHYNSPDDQERQKSLLEDEPEENEPPLKRSRLYTQGNHSSPAKHDACPSADTCTSELQPSGKQKMAEFTTESYETEDVELKPHSLLNHYQRKGKKQISSEASPVSEEDNDIVVLSDDDMQGPCTLSSHLKLKKRGNTSRSYPAVIPKRKLAYNSSLEEPNIMGSTDASVEGALVEYGFSDAMPLNMPLSDNLPGFDVPLAIVPSGIPSMCRVNY